MRIIYSEKLDEGIKVILEEENTVIIGIKSAFNTAIREVS